jgi:beta-N-acetylhexosaminidase
LLALVIAALLLGSASGGPGTVADSSGDVAAQNVDQTSVDDLLAGMSLADKVGQVFMLGFPGGDVSAALPVLTQLRAGGIVLTNNVTDAQSAQQLTTGLQQAAASNNLLPLLISVNHEGGDVQPIRGGMTEFGSQWSLGQQQPLGDAVAAACFRGDVHGRELAAIGINMNLAPDVDVWDNPANTVIGERSFSSDPVVAASLGAAYTEGLQRHDVLAVAKHFPGHGSSTDDSHQTLPVIQHDRAWLDAHELVPFRAAIQANTAAIMVGHLKFPLIDPAPGRPSSLSPVMVSGILRTDLGFTGLVITDDLGAMKAISAGFTPAAGAVQAFQAGSDMLLVVGPPATEREMVEALTDAVGSTIPPERLDDSVRRIVTAKIQAGVLPGEAPSLAPTEPVCPR